jgi:NAD(P)-dependent dehydrogenase (short-subunit alcohol dehydrogenase family)
MIAMVTGANRGIGFETVRGLVHRGARVAMVSRDRGRGAEALDRVRAETGNDSVELYVADLSSISEVRALAARFAAEHDRLDVLINNHNGHLRRAAGVGRRHRDELRAQLPGRTSCSPRSCGMRSNGAVPGAS